MKTPICILSYAVLLNASAFAENRPTADELVRQGITAERAGDPNAARAAYEKALQINPNHADARFHLGQVKIRRDTIARQGRQAALNRVMLPKVQFAEASLREALDALARSIGTESKGELTPNFVIQDPDGKFGASKITMDLKNLPATAALQYVLEQAGARARHDEFAIVIQPQ